MWIYPVMKQGPRMSLVIKALGWDNIYQAKLINQSLENTLDSHYFIGKTFGLRVTIPLHFLSSVGVIVIKKNMKEAQRRTANRQSALCGTFFGLQHGFY